MNRICIALAATMLLGIISIQSQAGYMVIPTPSNDERDARKVKLAQMAVLVSGLSTSRISLLLKMPKSADPSPDAGDAAKPGKDPYESFVTVYPVTIPLNARLLVATPDKGVVRQYGRILGAVEVITGIGGSEDKKRAKAGAYLLFAPINGPLTPELPLWLISLDVAEDGKVTYSVAARSTVKITPSMLGDKDPSPVVSGSVDLTKAAISISWKEQAYSFSYDLEIYYL